MTRFVTFMLVCTSGIATILFLALWWDRGFDEAWDAFEKFVAGILE